MAVAIEQQQPPPQQQHSGSSSTNKKSSSLWKRFKKSVNSNNNNSNINSGTSSQKTIQQQQQSKESSGIDNSQGSSSASRPKHNTTASNNNHKRSPSNDVVADVTPSGELSFFEAFSDFESSPQKNSPSKTKRTRSNHSPSSTADAGSTSEIYAVHSTSITTTPERSTPNSRPANMTYASSVATPSSPKSSKGTIYSLAGGGTVANTVAEKSIHTTKTRHSKNTCSTVSLTHDGSSTVDFSRSAAQHTQLSPVSKVTTDSDKLTPSNGGESVPHWTNFDDKQGGGEEVKGRGQSEWSLQPSTHHAHSSAESKEVVRDTSTIFSSRGSSSPIDENGSEAKEVSATRYIAPPSALTTKKAVAEMMTTTVVAAAAATSPPSQPVSTSLGSSRKSNSMRKAATGKLSRKSRNRGSSLKKRSGKDLLRASSTATENTTSVAALSAGKKVDVTKKAVAAASVPSQQARSDTNKVDGHKITVSPTSSPPSNKNVAKKEKTSVGLKSPGDNPAQPHLYAELNIPMKKIRKRPSSPTSPPSTSPGSSYLPRQSSTTSNGTNGEADVSLAMTSISSLTGRESLFGHAPRTQSSSMGGIWCHEEELGNGVVRGEVVNPDEEDYFDYSPNLEDNVVSGDDGMISRILKGLCHCFESIDGPTVSAAGGDATPTAGAPLTSGKSIAGEKSIGGAIDTVIETIDNTAATIANTMLSKSRSRTSKAPTFSEPMMKEI